MFKLRAVTSCLSREGVTLIICVSKSLQTPFGWFLVVSVSRMMAKVKVTNSLAWWL